MQIIDLSLELYTGMPVYPGDPAASIEAIRKIEERGWTMRRIEINSHDRTHVNVPSHCVGESKTLDDYPLAAFSGPATIYESSVDISADHGVIFRDQNIDATIAKEIIQKHPLFIGLSASFEFDEKIEKELLHAGIISFERITNTDKLPKSFVFYGMPLKIRAGDGSPVRAFAIVD